MDFTYGRFHKGMLLIRLIEATCLVYIPFTLFTILLIDTLVSDMDPFWVVTSIILNILFCLYYENLLKKLPNEIKVKDNDISIKKVVIPLLFSIKSKFRIDEIMSLNIKESKRSWRFQFYMKKGGKINLTYPRVSETIFNDMKPLFKYLEKNDVDILYYKGFENQEQKIKDDNMGAVRSGKF